MRSAFRRRWQFYVRSLKRGLDAPVGFMAVGLFKLLRRIDPDRMANFAGPFMRTIGPWRPEHRTGRANLRAAFPEKSDAEIEKILAGVWDNLGRIAVEFAHLDEFCIADFGRQTPDVITYTLETKIRYDTMAASGHAILGFAAHLANWELPAVVAKTLGTNAAILYRRPNIAAVSDMIVEMREPLMGHLIPNSLAAPVQMARLAHEGAHVGMLVDQHYNKGVEVIFFGRRCMANPLIAQLARQTGCPIHGLRVIRNPDGNSFVAEITEEIAPARDADGEIDLTGTMQAITSVVERWVRETPEQWLWLHRRWR
jgi:Kdo2-lipid IVA lauroyltransferase/acyltransferase